MQSRCRNMQHDLFSDELINRLAVARRVVVLTGAGVSAESDIPTFRDVGGIWSRFRPEELANVDAFLANPSLVQGWYRERKRIATEAEPNAGHHALVRFETLFDDFTLVTQNVDNLHQRAGSRKIIELHGNISRSYCIDCKLRYDGDSEHSDLPESQDAPIHCPVCKGLIRPDVVWFGEMLPARAIEQALLAALPASVCLSIGTSAVVYPAADIPLVARDAGAFVAEINIEPSAIATMLDETILGSSANVLPVLVDAVREARQSMKKYAT